MAGLSKRAKTRNSKELKVVLTRDVTPPTYAKGGKQGGKTKRTTAKKLPAF